MKVRKAVVPAAGYGTRFLPFTKTQPKEMLPLVDVPLIHHIVEEAVASGIQEITVVVRRGKQAIQEYFDPSPELERHLEQSGRADLLEQTRRLTRLARVRFAYQHEPLGLGHAILQAREQIQGEPFAVLLPDEVFFGPTPCLLQLIQQHQNTGGSVLGVCRVPLDQVNRYGVIQAEPGGDGVLYVTDVVEKPDPATAPSNVIITGRCILDAAIFDALERTPPGANREIQLTDALRLLRAERPVFGYEVQGQRFDTGEPLGYLQAVVHYALQSPGVAEEFRVFLDSLPDLGEHALALSAASRMVTANGKGGKKDADLPRVGRTG